MTPTLLPARWRGRSITIRTRLLVMIVLVAAIALATSGSMVYALQAHSIYVSVNDDLAAAREEVDALAHGAENASAAPTTSQPQTPLITSEKRYASPSELLNDFMARGAHSSYEGEMGFVSGKLRFVAAADVQLRPENDPELLVALQPLVAADKSVITTITTRQRHYRVLVAPVVFPAERGALVRVVDVDQATAQLRNTMLLYAVIAVLTVACVASIVTVLIRRLLRPIGELREAAESIDKHDLTSRVPVRGRDDLTLLARTVNRMLDRVENAVESQRDLLDDVGHELRTPITVVRGHLEVLDPEDPLDVQETRALVVDELDRMTTLVDDLLMLAKVAESDFVKVQPTRIDRLTDQVLDKASGLGERTWVLERAAAIECPLDEARITQAWLELAMNAVKYSPPGSRIGVGSRTRVNARGLKELCLYVKDSGPGIALADQERIRERFQRAVSATQTPGAGLGLNIVTSIVEAHGGFLEIDSRPGEGSTFSLVIELEDGHLRRGEEL